jgi:hypothetical protein
VLLAQLAAETWRLCLQIPALPPRLLDVLRMLKAFAADSAPLTEESRYKMVRNRCESLDSHLALNSVWWFLKDLMVRELVDEVLRLNTHYATLLQLLVDTGCGACFGVLVHGPAYSASCKLHAFIRALDCSDSCVFAI